MKNYYDTALKRLDEDLIKLNAELRDPVTLAENVIEVILKCLSELKHFVIEKNFINDDEEIHFFKAQKPLIVSKLIYYNALFKIEAKKPFGGEKVRRKYFNHELAKLKRFFYNNLEFYKYYRTNGNYLDHKYFLRGNYDIKLSLDTHYFEVDHRFSTSHDYKVAKIIANDLIQVYLESQLIAPVLKDRTALNGILNWSGSKTDLIELIYALNSAKMLNDGNTNIKVVVRIAEALFNLDLGDFYHTYLELKNRKMNRTKFIDSLRESLLRKMDEQDEK